MPIIRRSRDLDTGERDELARILAAHRAGDPKAPFLSDEGDFFAFLLLLFLAAAGGAVAILLELDPMSDFPELLAALRGGYLRLAITVHCFGPLFVVLVLLAAWAALTTVRLHRHCGVALLAAGVARVRGRRLAYVRFGDVRACQVRRFTMGKEQRRRVSAAELTLDDGKRITFYAFTDAIAAAVAAPRHESAAE
jgi:hypothetical protein